MKKKRAPSRKGSDLRKLLEWAKSYGFTCEVGGRHLIFRRPNTRAVYASSTPSCQYGRENTRRDLMRALAEAEQSTSKE